MRLLPEMEDKIAAAWRAHREAEKADAEARIEKASATGEPLRERYVNRAAFRTAYSKWKRESR